MKGQFLTPLLTVGSTFRTVINAMDFLGIYEIHNPAKGVHALVLTEIPTGVEFIISKTMHIYIAILPITVIRAYLLKLPQRSGTMGTVTAMTLVLWYHAPFPSINTV